MTEAEASARSFAAERAKADAEAANSHHRAGAQTLIAAAGAGATAEIALLHRGLSAASALPLSLFLGAAICGAAVYVLLSITIYNSMVSWERIAFGLLSSNEKVPLSRFVGPSIFGQLFVLGLGFLVLGATALLR